MGAVLNMRPDLFHAALVGVPFVDVMNTMLDESIPLTVTEFENGASQGTARVRLHDHLFALRQRTTQSLSQHAGQNLLQ